MQAFGGQAHSLNPSDSSGDDMEGISYALSSSKKHPSLNLREAE